MNNNDLLNSEPLMKASFSVIIMSIASSAAMSMGLTPNPEGQTEVNKELAKFNIDLINVLKNKTVNNLTAEEKGLIENILHDLQGKFLQL